MKAAKDRYQGWIWDDRPMDGEKVIIREGKVGKIKYCNEPTTIICTNVVLSKN